MIAFIKNLFSSGDAIQKTLGGVGDLAKDIKTIITGELDPEKKVDILLKTAEIELKFQDIASKVIIAEAQGSFLQKNWRPITMLTFLILVVCDSFDLLAFRLATEAWTLLQIGLGGYVAGRSIEKTVKTLKT